MRGVKGSQKCIECVYHREVRALSCLMSSSYLSVSQKSCQSGKTLKRNDAE